MTDEHPAPERLDLPLEVVRDPYRLSSNREDLDIDAIHTFLTKSYWAKGVSRPVVARSIAGSYCLGLYCGAQQIGFSRAVTDYATFAYLADVYVLPEHRGQGLARWMVKTLVDAPALTGLRRWILRTRDAHDVYRPLGFEAVENPGKIMERRGAPASS